MFPLPCIPPPAFPEVLAAQSSIQRRGLRWAVRAGDDEGVAFVRRSLDAKSEVDATRRVKAASERVSPSRNGAVSSF